MPITRTSAAIAVAATLTGCQDTGERSVAMLRPGSSFTVARIDGAPAPGGVTLDVAENARITGAAPCNRFSGQLTERDGAMSVSGMVMTRMACAEPERNLAEMRFGNAMAGIVAARRQPDGISLIDPEGRERIGLVPAGGG